MPGFYSTIASLRATEPDAGSLLTALRALDATAGVQHAIAGGYVVKKATAWTSPQIAAAQSAIDNAPAATAALAAQSAIDGWPAEARAFVFLVKDHFNILRANPALPLAAITDAQVLAAIRAKAGTL